MNVGWRKARAGASEADLAELERRLGSRLPDEYRAFLADHNGGAPETNVFTVSPNNSAGVNEYLSTRDIAETRARYGERLADGLVPVAYAEGGNLVVVSSDGTVYFWDHELEDEEPLTELAATFSAFRDSLEPFDPNRAELDPDDVEEVWASDALRKRLAGN